MKTWLFAGMVAVLALMVIGCGQQKPIQGKAPANAQAKDEAGEEK